MKIVRNKITYQVFYLFENHAEIRLDQYGMWGPTRALDMKDDTHEIVEDVSNPDVWVGGALMYDTDWSVYDHDIYNAGYDRVLQEEIESKCDGVMKIRLQKTYSDIMVQFPDGYGAIQFRNDFDRSNFGDIASGAQAMAAVDPSVMMYYRTADNITHPISCGLFVQMAVSILVEKQKIVSTSWAHKDTIRTMTTLEQVRSYNINEGWPV